MNSQDFMNQNNNRAAAIKLLQGFCHAHGMNYEYTEKAFTVKLPFLEPVPITSPATRRRVDTTGLDFLKPNPEGYHEDEQLPPADTPLEEGTPPEGTK